MKKTFPARRENLEEMVGHIVDFAAGRGAAGEKLQYIHLAAEEVLVNIISYAYPGEPGEVSISCEQSGEKGVAIEIRDHGVPFNPLAKEDPDIGLPPEKRTIGGLGIFLVKKFMDEIHYERKEGTNILRLVEYG